MRRAFRIGKLPSAGVGSALGCTALVLLTYATQQPLPASGQANPTIGTRDVPASARARPPTAENPAGNACEDRLTLASDTLFEFESADLSLEAELSLQVAGAILQQKALDHPVVIEGHTDAMGPDSYNDKLSERRAQVVRDWFVERGFLKPEQVTIKGYGKRRPIAPNRKPDGTDDPEGRKQNRRVDIIVRTCD